MLKKLFRRRPLIEELEPRILFSADLAPLALDVLQPAPEQRVINADGEFSSVAASIRNELIIVDASVQDYQTLIDDILRQAGDGQRFEIVVLDGDRDGVEQITNALQSYGDLDAVHLITHGGPGSLQLGSTTLDLASLDNRGEEITAWSQAFHGEGDWLIYGCDVASGAEGEAFVRLLGSLTQTDVAGSDDLTGSTVLGGDWDLEFRNGAIETNVILDEQNAGTWQGVLVKPELLDTANPMVMTPIQQITTVPPLPSGPLGDLVSSLIDTVDGSGRDNFVDPDGPGIGIAINGANLNGGKLFYSQDNGANWTEIIVGTLSNNNSFLLPADTTTRIYFQPAQNYTGYISNLLSLRAWDQSAGSSFNYGDTTGGSSGAFGSGQKNIAGQVTASGTNAPPTAANKDAAELYTLNTTLDLTDIVVSDADSGEVSVTLTLSDPTAGSLTTSSVGPVFDPTTSTFDPGTGQWYAKGSIADVNALLASVSFVPTTGYMSDFSIAVSISDGLAAPETGTKLMSVINAEPVVTTTGTALNYTENDPATVVDAGLIISDTVPGTLTGATVSLTDNYANGQDLLAFTNQPGISGSWDVDTGVLTLTGTASVANYETALRTVTYYNSSDSPSTLARTVSFIVNDGTSPSVAATRTVTVAAVNDPPVITSGSGSTASVSINENMTEATTVTATDVDLPAQTLSYSIVPVGSGGAADAAKFTISAAGVLSFIAPPDYETPTDADLNNVYDVTVQVSDGNGGTVTQMIAVTVNDLGGPLTVDMTADTVNGNTTSIEALLGDRGTDGLISLREAILATNATAGADIINLPDGTFTLTLTGNDATALLGDLDITDALTLRGTGSASTIIDATGLGDRLLEIFGVAVTVEDLTLRGGNAGSGGAIYVDAGSTVNFNRVRIDNNTGASGGAIYNFNSTLNLTDSTLAGNQSTGFGGAIYNDRGTLTLTRSTVSGNTAASDGGGLYSFGNGATLTLLNTTVSGNTAGDDGGGISSNKPVIITSSTIAYNSAATTGGGIHIVNPGSATLLNTIVANNTSSNTALSGNSNSAVTSLGGNIDSGNTLGLAQSGDQINTDPLLGVLQDNGGYTFTHALLAGSPAINLGIAGGPATDQRGMTRDATPDIGAYEYVYTGNVAPAISMSATPSNFTEGDLPVLVDAGASVNDPDSANFDGSSLTVQFSSGGTADDRLSLRDEGMGAGQIGIAGATLYYGGVMIGSFSGGTDGATPLVVLFNASADLASVQATLRNVSFHNASQAPSAISRNVTFQLTDGDGGVSNIASRVIEVTAVNDPPVNTVPGAQSTAKNTTLNFSAANGNAFAVSDVDAGGASVQTTLTVTSGVLSAGAGTTGVAVAGSGSTSLTLTGTLAQINNLLAGNLGGSLSFTPTTGFTGSVALTFITNDLGSSGSGGAKTDPDIISIAVTDASLWLSTDGSATSSAGSGNLSWADGQVVNFGNPNLALGSTTTGTFSIAIKLAQLANDGNVDIKGLHYVSQDTIVGTLNPITLLAGDMLFSVGANETFNGLNVTKQDLVRFRPTTPGDYSSGSFQIVLRNPGGTNNDIRDFALVERALTVGGTNLQAGDFLLVIGSASYDKDISLFRPTDMATPSTSGSLSLLVKGDSAGINNGSDQIWGLELVQQTITLDGQTLAEGTLLLSLDGPALVGTNGLSVQEGDVFALTVTATGPAASATASMLLESADVGLNGGGERFDALALVQRASAAPVVTVDASVLAYIENDLPSLIAPAATVTDADSSNLGGGSLSVYLSSNGTINDRLAIRNGGTIGISGSDVTYSGVIIGSFSGGEDGTTPLVISLNANATLAATQALLRNITYANVSDDPSTLPRTASFVLTDGSGGVSSTVSRTISVTSVNDAPTMSAPASIGVIEDVASVLSGISFSDDDAGSASVTASLSVGSGTLNAVSGGGVIVTGSGTSSMSLAGSIANMNGFIAGNNLSFTTAANATADVTLSVTIDDGGNTGIDPGTSGTASSEAASGSVTLTVTAANDPPVLASIGNQSVNEGSTLTFTASATDVDLPADTLSYSLDAASIALGMSIDASSGVFSWTPTEAQGGLTPSVTVTVTDNGTGTLADSETFTITVNDVNDPPLLALIGNQSVNEGSTLTFTASATDPDLPADTLTYSLDEASIALGMSIDSASGVFSWTPTEAQGGLTPTVTVTVTDNGNGTLADSETFTITVNEINTAPVGSNGAVTVNEDGTYVFSVGDFGFSDPDDSPANSLKAVMITSLPAAGTLLLDGNPVGAGQLIAASDIDLNLLTFVPAANANGSDYASFTFQVQDSGGILNGGSNLDPEPKTLTINVTAVNDAPTAVGSATLAAIAEDSTAPPGATVAELFATNFSNPEDAGMPSHNQFAGIAVRGQNTLTMATQGRWQYSTDSGASWSNFGVISDTNAISLGLNDRLRFMPVADYDGTTSPLTVRLLDNSVSVVGGVVIDASANGGITAISSDLVQLSTAITPENDAPVVALIDLGAIDEDGSRLITQAELLAGAMDIDADNLAAISLVLASGSGSLLDNNDGSWTFTPAADWNGAVSFSFAVDDGTVSISNTAILVVNPVNDAPVITSTDTPAVAEDKPASVMVKTLDVESDTMTFSISGGADAALFTLDPATGELKLIAVPNYEAPLDANGDNIYEVVVSVSDGQGGSASQAIHLVVSNVVEVTALTPDAPPPVVEEPPAEADESLVQAIALLAETPVEDAGVQRDVAVQDEDAGFYADIRAAVVKPVQVMFHNTMRNVDHREAGSFLTSINQALQSFTSEAYALQKLQNSLDSGSFQEQLNKLQETIRQQLNLDKDTLASTLAVSTGLSVGYVLWLVRGGVLLSSLLTSMPAWRLIDPLPILGTLGKRKEGDHDDDSLESLLKKSNAQPSSTAGDQAPDGKTP